jgi:predicted DNA binding CopG/RHH family protein
MTKRSRPKAGRAEFRIPTFATEAEEARWWYENRDWIETFAMKHGRMVPARSVEPTIPISIRLPQSDIQRAKAVAQKKGIPYQSLLKQVIREGLKKAG